MGALRQLLKQFTGDQRGVFGVIFAIMAVVMVALSGAVVDFVSLQQTRTRAQVALDAAALALQNRVFDVPLNPADIRAKALALVVERVNDTSVSITMDAPAINVIDGSLLLTAHMSMPTVFVSLVGVQKMGAEVDSQATRKKLKLEVAFVLDNSGSMTTVMTNNATRMANLKQAANCATNILFYENAVDSTAACNPVSGATVSANVKMAVVPFTSTVNVGAANSTQSWIDSNGISPIANDNFDNDDNDATPYSGTVKRLALFGQLTNDSWRGCLEARPHVATTGSSGFLDTDDTEATVSNPASMYVPYFAPDLSETSYNPGSLNNYTADSPASCDRPASGGASCTMTDKVTCNSSGGNCGSITTTYAFAGPQNTTLSSGQYVGVYPPACTCSASYGNWSDQTGSGNTRVFARTKTCTGGYTPTGLSQREYQERLCKYKGALNYTSNTQGPNSFCISNPILPLNASPTPVHASIDAMVADGATNIHEGTIWGFRALSPTAPFTQGSPYDQAVSKVMILMTDGENTHYPLGDLNGAEIFMSYGYPYNSLNTTSNPNTNSPANVNRLGALTWTDAQLETEMDTRTTQSCTNAKAMGINIYVIGLATNLTSNPTKVKTLLTGCASTADQAYFPNTPAELNTVFTGIAKQLAALRLAQ